LLGLYCLDLKLPMLLLMWVVLGLGIAAVLCCSVQLLREVDCGHSIAGPQLLL
jgi:hypothetical protein